MKLLLCNWSHVYYCNDAAEPLPPGAPSAQPYTWFVVEKKGKQNMITCTNNTGWFAHNISHHGTPARRISLENANLNLTTSRTIGSLHRKRCKEFRALTLSRTTPRTQDDTSETEHQSVGEVGALHTGTGTEKGRYIITQRRYIITQEKAGMHHSVLLLRAP